MRVPGLRVKQRGRWGLGASARAARTPRPRNGFRGEERAAGRNWGRKSRALSDDARLSPRSPNRLTAEDAPPVPRPSRGEFLGTPGRGRLPADTAAVRRAGPGSGTFTRRRLPKLQLPAGPAPPWSRALATRPRSALGPVGAGRQRLLELVRWRGFPCGRALQEGQSFGVYVNGR